MNTLLTYSARWLVIVSWFMLLLTACSAIAYPTVIVPAKPIVLGTTFWTVQNTAKQTVISYLLHYYF